MSRPLSTAIRLGRNSLIYGAASVTKAIFGIFLVKLNTRFLQPDELGLLALCQALATLVSNFAPLGLHGSHTKLFFGARSEHERRQCTFTLCVAVVALALISCLAFEFIGPAYLSRRNALQLLPLLRIAFYYGAAQTLWNIPFSLLRAQDRAPQYSGLMMLQFAVQGVGVGFVVLHGGRVLGILETLFLVEVTFGCLYTLLLLRYSGILWSGASLRQGLSFGIPLIPHIGALWLLGLGDRFILEKYVTLAEIGLYSVACSLGSTLSLVSNSFANAWSPYIQRQTETQGEACFPEVSLLLTRVGAVFILLGAILASFSREAILLLARPQYLTAVPLLGVLALGGVFHSLYLLASPILWMDKPMIRRLPLVTAASAILSLTFNLLLIPQFSVLAAAGANCVAELSLLLGVVLIIRAGSKFPFRWRSVSILLGVSGTVAAFCQALQSWDSPLSLPVRLTVVTVLAAWVHHSWLVPLVKPSSRPESEPS